MTTPPTGHNGTRLRPWVVVLLLGALIACNRAGTPAVAPSPSSEPPVVRVVGFLTRIDNGDMLRMTTDGRSLLFHPDNSPVPEGRLRELMAPRSSIRVA